MHAIDYRQHPIDGKLIKEGWSFDINQEAQVATTPSGAKVNLRIRGDDIIELPHST